MSVHRGDAHPKAGTPEYEALERHLADSLSTVSGETNKELRRNMAAHILRFMVKRNYWPLGTRVTVKKNFTVKCVFPGDGN